MLAATVALPPKKEAAAPSGKTGTATNFLNLDDATDSISTVRFQHLRRLGIPPALAAIISPLAFGEVVHG